MNRLWNWTMVAVLGLCAGHATAWAAPFSVSYLDGASWNTVFVQGFSPSLGASPNPGLGAGATVYLNQFQFYKSGNADSASNIRLAILNNIFGDLTGLSTGSPLFVGLSTNTVASTAGIATGDPIAFSFNSLPVTYGNNYAAVFVNVGGGGTLTPVRVSALTADYIEVPPGSGSFHPETNYGTESQFVYATSNFITTNQFGQFFNTFSFAGDANFIATLNTVPEPTMAVLAALGAGLLACIRRRR
jgi:PEP-CTERM motif